MWTRERRLNNMVINDPKGELLVKFYVRGTVRGFQIIQFNLINAVKTDIYNPLGLAAESAREGDFTKVASYVGNIAEVFFPVDNAEEPMWPNAANNAFKRAAYGMIDYYLEEEKELRAEAELTGMDEKVLETKVDELWGKVTLYNTYQMFVQLAAKKMKNPAIEFTKKAKAGAFDYLSDDAYQDKLAEVEQQSKLWEDKPELDLLTLYFNATKALPRNSMRELVNNADDALRSMGGAEKMLASVYGIAITAMSFFTDPTISTLTSGTPSQNVDLAGMSFPRCLGVRFHPEFLEQYHLVGMQAKWMSYDDKEFQHPLGDAFYHEDLVSREGWAKYYFEGKYPRDVAYVHLQLVNPKTGMLVRQFYFQFRKSYQTSLDGRYYMTDPILEERIVKNGVLVELRRYKKRDGTIVYRKGKTTFSQMKIKDVLSPDRKKEQVRTTAVIRTLTRYSEKPKMVFLVTPPHLAQYAKLILILIKQLVDLNFDQSYMTKASQKPLLKTRFMLDEVGNLQSEGHGISNFQTFLSIGLGQDQQFTLVLQTLQQLRDVYGDSVDKIIQGNTNNIIFLKSTDDTLLDTLQKMSGKHHVAHLLSKQVSENKARLFMRYEDVVTKTYQVQEEPVISYNDMAFISERNSIVFRAGDSPIWNRNELILPMSWRLFSNTIEHPGHKYSLQTIPTLSSALDFDVRKNQPNFQNMLEKRMAQAQVADQAREAYQNAYGYTDYEITRKDQEVYSDEIMTIIRQMLAEKQEREKARDTWEDDAAAESPVVEPEENPEVAVEVDKAQAQLEDAQKKRYAGGMLSREDLVPMSGTPNHQWDDIIRQSYLDVKGQFWQDHNHFVVTKNGDFCDRDGTVFMREIPRFQEEKDAKKLKEEAEKEVIPSAPRKNVFYYDNDLGEQDLDKIKSYEVTDDFYYYLVTCETWNDFAFGAFEQAMARRMAAD